MTPTEQDKLRELLEKYADTIETDDGEYLAVDIDHIVEPILQLIIADRKRVALEARIDEMDVALAEVTHWSIDDSDSAIHGYGKHRIAELKAKQEEL